MFSEAPINPSQQSPSPGESLPTGAERSEGFRFHYTVGSGSSRKAIGTAALAATNPDALDPDDLEALLAADVNPDAIPPPGCAMISYARRDNHLFEGPNWFIDSGGYSVQKKFHHYPTSIDDYIAYLSEYDDQIDKYTLRDWVCDLALLREADRDVRTHQEWSIRDHVYCLEAAEDADLTAEPVAVLQGHDLEEYLWSFDYLEEHGLASPTLGIGSILRPNKTSEVRAIIQELRDAIPSKYALHGFGISKTVLEDAETLRALDSADTTSWHSKAAHARVTDPEWADRVPAWIRTLQAYMDYVDAVDALIADAYADESAGAATEPGHSRVVPLSAFAAGQSSRPDVADPLVECICGNLVDPNRHPYEENTAWCRFCEQLQFDLWNRQFCVDDTDGVDTDGYCPSQEL